jgi:hypothetical protein
MLFIEIIGYGLSSEDRQAEQAKCVAITKALIDLSVLAGSFQIYGQFSAAYNCPKALRISYDANDKNRFRFTAIVQALRDLGFNVFWQQILGHMPAKLQAKKFPVFV